MLKSEAIAEILRQDFRLLDHAQKERTAANRLVTNLSRDLPAIRRLKKIPGRRHGIGLSVRGLCAESAPLQRKRAR
jgi:ribosomal protein S13